MSGDCKKGEKGKHGTDCIARGKTVLKRGRYKVRINRKTFPYGKQLGTGAFKRERERETWNRLHSERENGV